MGSTARRQKCIASISGRLQNKLQGLVSFSPLLSINKYSKCVLYTSRSIQVEVYEVNMRPSQESRELQVDGQGEHSHSTYINRGNYL